ncbi:hypothetical protein AAVH_15681 [Aphelenchoides avenae]|nr:hypothetical protein AAVH_15681 [Aphelenchus avenae]
MSLRDKLDFIVNEKIETMESIINEIFARSTTRAFKFDEKNNDAKATLRRLKESQTWLGTQVEELRKQREQLGSVGQTYLAALSPQDRLEAEARLDEVLPDLDERIEIVAQTLYSGLKHQVIRMEDIVAKVATGLFNWIPLDKEMHEDDRETTEALPDSVAPKSPVDGVIDVDSVREQLADFSAGLCTIDESRGFAKITKS